MVKIQFTNSADLLPVSIFKRVSPNVVCFDIETENTSGFYTYVDDRMVGDFTEFKTVYRHLNGVTYFSNNGSKYIEPTTEIIATFDDELPTKIGVKLSNGDSLTLEGDFKAVVKGENITIVEAERLEKYNQKISGNVVSYTLKSQAQQIEEEVKQLHKELDNTDYKIIKCSEYQLAGLELPYDIVELHRVRQELRDRINELENGGQ